MSEDRNEKDRLGGEYMIQDRDHSSSAQVGGSRGGRRQSEQSQGDSSQPGDSQHSGDGQQGGERNAKRRGKGR